MRRIMEYRINCRHIDKDLKCNSPYMKKRFWIFRRNCLVIDRLVKCWYREDLVGEKGTRLFKDVKK